MISIRGAKEHNLKNVNVDLPRNKLIVITGLSGSGKSSLALIQSMPKGSAGMWNPFPPMPASSWGKWKSRMDYITGLSPAISIDQKTTSRNPPLHRRHSYRNSGLPAHSICSGGRSPLHKCGKPIERQSVDQMIEQVFQLPEGARLNILSPVVPLKEGRAQENLFRP